MAAYLSPVGNDQQADSSGAPVSGALIYTYLAGTTTPVTTYTDAAGLVPQANPIVCNSAGYPASPIYLSAGQAVKMVFTTSVASGSVAYRPAIDNITGVNDPSALTLSSEWVIYTGTPTFISATSYSLAGDQTNVLTVDRRIRTVNTGGTRYSTITASAFSAGITTVTVSNDSGVLDSGLSQVSYALLASSNQSLPASIRLDVASATTVDLTAATASATRDINITGTTAVTAFTVPTGLLYRVRFAASLTLTNGASLVTQSGANIVTQAGDTCLVRSTAANTVEVLSYVRAFSNLELKSLVRVVTANGLGSTNTAIRRFSGTTTNQGSDITYADSATLGGSFTINTAGVYAISYVDNFNAANNLGISVNSAQLTTSIISISITDRASVATTSAANFSAVCSATLYLAAGSVVRAHTAAGSVSGTDPGLSTFLIQRVA